MATAETVITDQKELDELRRENARLKRRIADRAKQEKAKWLLVGYFGWTESEAHFRLMRAASIRNLKLTEIVDRLAAMVESIEELCGEVEA